MRQDQGEAGAPLWTDGDMMLRVVGIGRESDRIVRVRRSFALIGQAADSDICIADPAVSARHVYLHLDPRGLYVVDLVTRTGTRIKGENQLVGWLRPTDSIEVAGRRIELLRLRIAGVVVDPPPCAADMLSDLGPAPLVDLTLEPKRGAEGPWVIGSELVFLGWSASCGIQIKDASVARTHCALVRTATAAYVVDLCGHHTTLHDRPVRGASTILDGETLTIGSTSYLVRIAPPAARREAPAPARAVETEPEVVPEPARLTPVELESRALAPLVARVFNPELVAATGTELVPVEAQHALVAWLLETIQASQETAIRQQGEYHLALADLIRQVQQDNAAVLNTHLERIERVDRELANLRAELAERNEPAPAPESTPLFPGTPPPPNVTPLRINRNVHEPASGTKASTTWLLDRVNQLETENRSAWKDLVSRLGTPRKAE